MSTQAATNKNKPKRHRKPDASSRKPLSKGDMDRLKATGGVKSVRSNGYDATRLLIVYRLEKLLRKSLLLMAGRGKTTLEVDDVSNAIADFGERYLVDNHAADSLKRKSESFDKFMRQQKVEAARRKELAKLQGKEAAKEQIRQERSAVKKRGGDDDEDDDYVPEEEKKEEEEEEEKEEQPKKKVAKKKKKTTKAQEQQPPIANEEEASKKIVEDEPEQENEDEVMSQKKHVSFNDDATTVAEATTVAAEEDDDDALISRVNGDTGITA